jgi:uncharacterized protein
VQEMCIYGVSFDMVSKQPIVLLKTASGKRFLPIWIGHAEAAAILAKLQGTEAPRPMTHDLMNEILGELHTSVARITVTELRENTFHALITLRTGLPEGEVEVDSRPSDAIAIAVRANAPIFAADKVIDENGIEFDEDGDNETTVEQFKQFLDSVSPEDFAG